MQGVEGATQLQHLVLPAGAVGDLSARVCCTLRDLPTLRRVSLTGSSMGHPTALHIARCQLGRAEMLPAAPIHYVVLTFLPDMRSLTQL